MANTKAITSRRKSGSKKSKKRTVIHGQVHIAASFNNTIVMISDQKGNTLVSSSSGACGFRGGKKGTAYAASVATEKVINTAINNFGVKKVDVFVKGIGQGRDSSLRILMNRNLVVESITDRTKIAHGGVRPRKARRI